MKKFGLMLILFLFILPLTAIAAEVAKVSTPIISIDNLIAALTPLIVFGVTWVIKKIMPTIMGWNIIWVVVPILSLIASAILSMIDTATSFWSQFIWNFLAVVVAQLISQLTPDKRADKAVERNKLLAEKK